MGRGNVCVKRSYVAVTTLTGAISAMLLAYTLFSHGYFHEKEEVEHVFAGLHVLYAISILTLLFTVAGLFGACKEKKWALILFAVGMMLASLFMFGCGINIAVAARPEVTKELKRQYHDMVHMSNYSKEVFKEAQIELQCCGLEQGYSDWGYDIPRSCLCNQESTAPCVQAPRNSSLGGVPLRIYREPCIPKIIDHVLGLVGVLLGIVLGVMLLWVLAVVLCIVLLCQLGQKAATPTVEFTQEAKLGIYTVLVDPNDLS